MISRFAVAVGLAAISLLGSPLLINAQGQVTVFAGRNQAMPDVDPTTVVGVWVHSHEEDLAGTQVFRRSGYGFPRSRGRLSYELRPDGALGGSRPGPDDRHVATTGTWDLQGRKLTITSAGGSPLHYEIQSVDADRMVVKPVTNP